MSAAEPKETRVSLKGLAKYLGRYTPIAVEDVTNPTCERTLDIFWYICCHVYGEDEMNTMMRGKEKRMALCVPVRYLFSRLLPKLKPEFTMRDLVFPTKERMVIFYSALMNFLKVWNAQKHKRDIMNEEKLEMEAAEQKLRDEIAEASEQAHRAKGRRDQSLELCNQLQDKFFRLEDVRKEREGLVTCSKERVERVKRRINDLSGQETELKAKTQSESDKIATLELCAVLPKAEHEERQKILTNELEQLQEELKWKQNANMDLCCKIKASELDKISAIRTYTALEDAIKLDNKNRKEKLECDEASRSLEKAVADSQAELLRLKQEQVRQSEAFLTEKTSLELRTIDLERDSEQLQTVKDDLSESIHQLQSDLAKLKIDLEKMHTLETEEKAKRQRYLEAKNAGEKHLKFLMSKLETSC